MAIQAGSSDAATQHDQLLAEHGILGHELSSRARQIRGGTEGQFRHRAGSPQQMLDRSGKGDERGSDQMQDDELRGRRVSTWTTWKPFPRAYVKCVAEDCRRVAAGTCEDVATS